MKRKDAIQKLKSILQDWDGCAINTKAARQILTRIEREIGMAPPHVGSEIGQAIADIYIYPDFNQWEETVMENEEVVDKIEKRAKAKAERKSRRLIK